MIVSTKPMDRRSGQKTAYNPLINALPSAKK
jgi:hypothetical protein